MGIDPGYERLGLAVVETSPGGRDKLLYSTCLITSRTDSFPHRLKLLATGLQKVLAEYSPEVLAVEKLFFSGNQKTAMHVSEVRGMIIYLGVCAGVTLIDLTPLQVKMAITGYGRASKPQLTTMIKRLVAIPSGKRHDDEYDAIGIALAGAAHARQILIHNQARQ
ncbi:MAG TPA: crossover junction endodeoxyribonuclease RuvC [Candidatus Paceibacterota bacterium]